MSSRRVLKDLLYEQVGRLVKGMANAKRLELVELLCQAPKSVETLATEAGISVKLASAHLKELRLAHLVDTEKQGRQVIYRIACPEVAGLLVMMRTLAEDRLFELQHSLKELSGSSEPWVETDSETLWHRAQHGEVTVIDVRPVLEYAQRHLPYARSMPLAELKAHLKDIPKDKPVVAYCRGPFCALSVEAVKLLQAEGFQAYQWREGAADWIAGSPEPI
ncbi:MAG: ArsR family transcriptional regulator [Sterolibacterium sp.]|jgi:rhodanese-related sulfurtransferase/DNA-binding transcriptional ArsR family regulator|nr:ArsR family transcriptional regulator [Sterolibacterium sp.]